tara:strand:- start:2856 stop:3404 length:549 start_codon:yes stop_codon:yes gene_type:complete
MDSLAMAELAGNILAPKPPATIIASSTAVIAMLTPSFFSSVAPQREFMGEKSEWRLFAATGVVLVGITFTDLSPSGPWNDETFTSGALGLTGLLLLYIAWFRLTFQRKGLVPTIDLWSHPQTTSKTVFSVGLVVLAVAYAVGRIDYFPEPAGLVLSLIGLLVTTNGFYVWLSTAGPLSQEEE